MFFGKCQSICLAQAQSRLEKLLTFGMMRTPIVPPIYGFVQFFQCTIWPRILDTIFYTLQLSFCLILTRKFTWEEKMYMLHLLKFRKDKNLELRNKCSCWKSLIKILFLCKVKVYVILIMNLRIIWSMKGHGIKS